MAKYASPAEGFAAARLAQAERHLFLCLGPDCAPMEQGQMVWDYLKRRCGELNLPVLRTKAGCFRVCVGGPWLLVYPEGTWYGSMTVDRCEQILQQHIIHGSPVTEWAERTHPLCPSKPA
jgi:(2Fe-2S) ferredoxin